MQVSPQTPQGPNAAAPSAIGTALLAAVVLAAWRVAGTMSHPRWKPFIEETAWLLLSWVLAVGTAAIAILLILWARREMTTRRSKASLLHLLDDPQEKGLRALQARHPLSPAIATLAIAIAIDALFSAAATKTPASAMHIDFYREIPVTLFVGLICSIVAVKLLGTAREG